MHQEEIEKVGSEVAQSLSEASSHFEAPEHSVSMKDANSKYKLSSAMQKCIRRGLADKAVYFAQAIFNGGEAEYLWRRLPIIALEDVGLADMMLCAQTLHFCRFKSVRLALGERKTLSYLVHALAAGVKSRTLCDMACSVYFMKNKLERWTLNAGKMDYLQSVQTQTMMDMLAHGWEPEGEIELKGHSSKTAQNACLNLLMATGGPIAAYTAYAGQKKGTANLHMPLEQAYSGTSNFLTDTEVKTLTLPEPVYLQGVPDWSFDQHTLDGKRAISYLIKSSSVLKAWASGHQLELTSSAVNMVLFQTESALLDKQLVSPLITSYQTFNDDLETEHVGLTPQAACELKILLNSEKLKVDLLYARRRVLNLT